MDKPFKYIVNTSVYNLRWGGYGWRRGDNSETLAKCITDTATYYDQTQVTPAQFKRMIDKITQGATNSPLHQRACVDETVQAICIYYPGHLTTTNVTSLIKCFTSKNTVAVEYIESTGYKFTSAQYKALNKAGILMTDKMESMSLSEFYSLFANVGFQSKINGRGQWEVNPDHYEIKSPKQNNKDNKELTIADTSGYNVVPVEDKIHTKKGLNSYSQYEYLKQLIDRFDIQLDVEFWGHMIGIAASPQRYASSYFTIQSLLNLHRVVVALGYNPTKTQFLALFRSYRIDYDNFNDTDTMRWLDKISAFYPDTTIDRNDIIEICVNLSRNISNVNLLIKSKMCSYDPMLDLYYWLNNTFRDMRRVLINRVKESRNQELYLHLVSLGHIEFEDFRNYIQENPDCGWDNEEFIRTTISFSKNADIIKYYVDNKLIVNLDLLNYVRCRDTIDNIYRSCTSYDEKGFDRIIELTHEKKTVIGIDSSNTEHDSFKYRVYRTLSPRDRRIMTHNSGIITYPLINLKLILRYDIQINPIYLEYLLSTGNEELVITLLHMSRKYNYLIGMIDLDMVLKCRNYLPRMWFYTFIVLPRTIDDMKAEEFNFCPFDRSEEYIFNVEMNDKENADLPLEMVDQTDKIRKTYRKNIQEIQEAALERILDR